MKVEIFKSGNHINSAGEVMNFSSNDLAQIANSYNVNSHEAPIVVGHPSENAPAYGWIKGLKVENNSLIADFGELDEDFKTLVKNGRYKKLSASFYDPQSKFNPTPNKWYLRHVGFLGAQPPAIKGLKQATFAENESIASFELEVNFCETCAKNSSVEETAKTEKQIFNSTNGETNQMEEKLAQMQKKLDEANSKLANFEKEKAKQEVDALVKENADFAESLIKEGKILPVFKETVVNVLNALSLVKTSDFSEFKQDLNTVKRNFKGYLNASGVSDLTKKTDFNQSSTSDFSEADLNSSDALNEQVLKVAEAKKITYEEALSEVLANMKGAY